MSDDQSPVTADEGLPSADARRPWLRPELRRIEANEAQSRHHDGARIKTGSLNDGVRLS